MIFDYLKRPSSLQKSIHFNVNVYKTLGIKDISITNDVL